MNEQLKCPFCTRKKISDQIVWENTYIMIVVPLHPRCRGHLLVIPKSHAPALSELKSDFANELIKGIKIAQSLQTNVYHAEGFNILINQDKAAGQEVFHVHIHVLPRWQYEPHNPLMLSPDFLKELDKVSLINETMLLRDSLKR
jgi:histidine triad (HIT) family protein